MSGLPTVAEIRAMHPDAAEAVIRAMAEAIPVADVRRGLVADKGRMLRRAAKYPKGRIQLHRHRQIALDRLKTETDPVEAGWAAWMLRAVEAALKIKIRKQPAKKSTPTIQKSHREQLNSIAISAQLACSVLAPNAYDLRWNTARTEDVREAYHAAERILKLATEGRK